MYICQASGDSSAFTVAEVGGEPLKEDGFQRNIAFQLGAEARHMARIVIIEDDVELSTVMRDALKDTGYEVITYVQPNRDTVQHLNSSQPDLIVIDARLTSSVSGWDVITGLKDLAATRSIPIILASGAADEIVAHQDLLNEWGIPVLAKPFDLAQLDRYVGEALERPAATA
jgi:DNA-binding response OmpR family regulator